MSDNGNHTMASNDDDSARLTADVLGQLNAEQHQQLRRELEQDANQRAAYEELAMIAAGLTQQHAAAAAPAPAPALREAVVARLGGGQKSLPLAEPVTRRGRSPGRENRGKRPVVSLLLVTAGLLLLAAVPVGYALRSDWSRSVAMHADDGAAGELVGAAVRASSQGMSEQQPSRDRSGAHPSTAQGKSELLGQPVSSPEGRPLVATGSAPASPTAAPAARPEAATVTGNGDSESSLGVTRGTVRLAGSPARSVAADSGAADSGAANSGAANSGAANSGAANSGAMRAGAGRQISKFHLGGMPADDYGTGVNYGDVEGFGVTQGAPGMPASPAHSPSSHATTKHFGGLAKSLTVAGQGGAVRGGAVSNLNVREARFGRHDGFGRGAESVVGEAIVGDRPFSESKRRRLDEHGGYWYFDPAASAANREQYELVAENPFIAVRRQAVSTFSIDADTASYANVRRFLRQGQLPPPAAVRIEELVNYFSYDYAGPEDDRHPFATHMEVAECPWHTGHQLLRVALQGKRMTRPERPGCNLVFLLDVSGSMKDNNKLPLLKQAMKLLVEQLGENDRVAIVTYASQAGVRLPSTVADQHETIRAAIDGLRADGSTNGGAGIQMAYEQALAGTIEGGVNRVILATDGDLNVGITDDDALVRLIKEKAAAHVFLTVLGFGEGNLQDAKLEKLADNGNGVYAYVDSLREARKVLVEQVEGSLVTIAKDVKVKIEFNPAEVDSYRLIGYENRLMTAAEFDDDRKDAGEIGAGHAVTALYEIVPAKPAEVAAVDPLKYQQPAQAAVTRDQLTDAAMTGELLTLFLRYKPPASEESTLLETPLLNVRKRFSEASIEFRFAAAVASYGMLLRGSTHQGDTSFAAVEEIAAAALGRDEGGYRTEFLDLVRQASALK